MNKTIRFDKTGGFQKKYLRILRSELKDLPDSLWEIEFRKPVRTSKQSKSIHLFCKQLAAELNGVGATFKTISIMDGTTIEADWSKDLVKEHIWKPVQKALLNKPSTRKITTTEVDVVAKPIIENLTVKYGFGLLFPSRLSQYLEEEAKKQ